MSEESARVTMVDFTRAQRFDGIATLEAYWQSVRGNRLVPLRSDIDPRGIEGALDYSFIVERVTAGVVRFRLAGSQLNEMMGMDVRGMPITALFGTKSRADVLEAIEGVFSGPEVIEMPLESPGAAGKPTLPGQMILLPLKSDLGDISRAIGCLPTRGPVGRSPRRFELSGGLKRRPLNDGAEKVVVTRRPQKNVLPEGFGEPQPTFRSQRHQSAERPYLKLVREDGDK
ncbi:MAG: PAS domain-containing protein [Pseudomonadota bacterium]